ncbi:MAG: lysyl oxidase family protein [Myxococcota bacterium]
MLVAVLLAFALLSPAVAGAQVVDLLPDVITVRERLFETALDETTRPGRILLRLSSATPNIGAGPLEILPRNVVVDGREKVNQRIYRSDGTWWGREAGTFSFHRRHDHIHFNEWAAYRLREITDDGGVGELVAGGDKTSFCLVDLFVYDASHPNFPSRPGYTSCGHKKQGISPGWGDLYHLSIPGQSIDITEVDDGTYWLEAEVDPENRILEEDETNNVSRVRVAIGPPPPAEPDAYEDNDSFDQADAGEEGAPGSPNLGLVNAPRVIEGLSMEAGDGGDYFRFRTNNPAGAGDYVRVESPFQSTFGDLDLRLYDGDRKRLAFSESFFNFEQISLNNRPAGVYYARVMLDHGEVPAYTFSIEPAGNTPPELELFEPPPAGFTVQRAFETFPVSWIASDPEGDPVAVSLFVDRDGVFDKETQILGGYENLDGEAGIANILTAPLELGEWFVYAQASDGGGITGAWAPGTVTIYVKGDVDFDGQLDQRDFRSLVETLRSNAPPPPGWNVILDMDLDGRLTSKDIPAFRHAMHEQRHGSSAE